MDTILKQKCLRAGSYICVVCGKRATYMSPLPASRQWLEHWSGCPDCSENGKLAEKLVDFAGIRGLNVCYAD